MLIGWIVIAISTFAFWSYSFNFAPSSEVQRQVAMKDGAPQVFSLFFGWVYALVILAALELINLLWIGVAKIKFKLGNNA